MRNALLLSIACVAMISLVGCPANGPDLKVICHDFVWDAARKEAKAEIKNIGAADAGEFMVYFNGEENPESQNHRPQDRHHVSGLAAGESIFLEADFKLLEHPDNLNLANVHAIRVMVDPKNMVRETDETNNECVMLVQ